MPGLFDGQANDDEGARGAKKEACQIERRIAKASRDAKLLGNQIMRTSSNSYRAALVLIAGSALLMQGCAAAVVATAAGVGGLGYAYSQEQSETIASATPSGGPDPWGQPTAVSEPIVLVEPQAPIESVEVQTIQ